MTSVLRSRNPISPSLHTELESLVKTPFPKLAKTTSTSTLSSLETYGREIWNASTNIIRGVEPRRGAHVEAEQSANTPILLRAFAFMLLDFAYQSCSKRQKDQDKLIRTLKLGVKACKSCLDNGELDLASETIQKCGHYVAAATGESPLVNLIDEVDKDEGRRIVDELATEVCLLRITHGWKVGRLDMAEHFYLEFATGARNPASAPLLESAADLLHQIGRSLLKNKMEELAVRWLQRALATLDSCDVTQLSQDASEARLAFSVSLGEHCQSIFGREHTESDSALPRSARFRSCTTTGAEPSTRAGYFSWSWQPNVISVAAGHSHPCRRASRRRGVK